MLIVSILVSTLVSTFVSTATVMVSGESPLLSDPLTFAPALSAASTLSDCPAEIASANLVCADCIACPAWLVCAACMSVRAFVLPAAGAVMILNFAGVPSSPNARFPCVSMEIGVPSWVNVPLVFNLNHDIPASDERMRTVPVLPSRPTVFAIAVPGGEYLAEAN